MHIARKALLCVLAMPVLVSVSDAQMTWSNGVLGLYLSNAGNVRAGLSPYSSTTRDVARMTIVAAQSPTAVFDYNTDQNGSALQPAQRITVAGVDTAFEALTDNSYSNTPPKIKVRVAVMTWKNVKYAIVRYRVINDTSVAMSLWVGGHIVPYISATYGGETVQYHAASKTGYYYRQGVTKYWGMRLLGKNPTSFRTMDWNTWSTDPGSEVTSDSMRYAVTATGGFDSLGTASADGSVMQLNAGQVTIAKGDSATFYYALVYGASLNEMVASGDSAVAKFGKVFTDVRQTSSLVPEKIALSQNYPNPFNPTTKIDFQLSLRGWTRLTVFDLLGREVAMPVNAELTPGSYTVEFKAEGLTSGVYVYRLQVGQSSEVRRMIVLK